MQGLRFLPRMLFYFIIHWMEIGKVTSYPIVMAVLIGLVWTERGKVICAITQKEDSIYFLLTVNGLDI